MSGAVPDLALTLLPRMRELVEQLLPGGRQEGCTWRCGGLAGGPGRSLIVYVSGYCAGTWCDFAAHDAGDVLDLISAVRCGGDRDAAISWAFGWLGDPSEDKPEDRRPSSQRPITEREASAAAAIERRREAQMLCSDGRRRRPHE